jgi:amino acid transporter
MTESTGLPAAVGSPGRDDASANELRRGALGVGFVVFFVVSAAAPLTALAGGIPVGMLLGNGAGMPGLFAFVTVLLLVFAAGYTAMARHVRNAGSFYAFTSVGLGRPAGGAAGLIALLGYNCMQIGLYGLFGVAASGLFAEFGLELPWWLYGYAALALVGVLGYRRVDLSAKVLAVLVLAEYLIMIVFDAVVIGQGGADGLNAAPFQADTVFTGSPSIGILFCFAAFLGFEASTIYSEEAKDPHRTVPTATFVSILVIGLFYTFSSWATVMAAGADRLGDKLAEVGDPTTLLFVLSDQFAGPAVTRTMQILFVSSIFAALVAFHNAVSRYFYVLGREGLIHGHLGRTHGTYQSPYMGSVLQTVVAVVVVAGFAVTGADPVLTLFSWLTNLATLCVIALMAMASFAVIVYFRRKPDRTESPMRVVVLPVVAGLALLAILALAIVNFSVLTGASVGLAWGLTALLPLSGIVGAVLASRLRRAEPHKYERLGSNRL